MKPSKKGVTFSLDKIWVDAMVLVLKSKFDLWVLTRAIMSKQNYYLDQRELKRLQMKPAKKGVTFALDKIRGDALLSVLKRTICPPKN